MGKPACRLIVCGAVAVGKTAMVEQILYGNHNIGKGETFPTIEDVYEATVETNRGTKERIRFYDTKGLDSQSNPELPRHFYNIADGMILVYTITSVDTFRFVEKGKREVDRDKRARKREISLIIIGNKADLNQEREVDFDKASKWAKKEKIPLFEVTVANRKGLMEPIVSLTSKLTTPPTKSPFQLSVRNFKPRQLQSFSLDV
ncbi:putative NF-kappa-B inhibitor-interacting Ras-like protein 2 [Apostichopus japonicus]|uniref:Putative NF-kappa-B inhibitor-interacting Ras-like protein 2 n=1 Tax=Stichopus japonicus TaxID=307972 RepID=A0A2G8JIF6_STIJA|nr:putative NF-kappa-B inhibitor-interacting Ras-like protein 2 [Apostichopus japonicus]